MNARPFSLLIKPASADCNLRCTYCFYLDRSKLYPEAHIHRMSDEILERMIKGYLTTTQLQYSFGWQGGEPTLMGAAFFQKIVDLQQKYGEKGAIISNGLQTNATLITDELAEIFSKYNFLLGVSLDGPKRIHDCYRLTVGGQDTFDSVWKGIQILQNHKVEFNILTLVNASNVDHGREIYRYFANQGLNYHQYIPCVEFDDQGKLLPYAINGEEWGTFLCDIFDEWIQQDVYRVSIRLFDSILSFLVDGRIGECPMGGNCCQYFVVEHTGDIYPCDFFVASERKIGNILENIWPEMLIAKEYLAFGQQKSAWNTDCFQCEYVLYCSGDCLKHRIYNGNPSEQRSWLCLGWKKFYKHAIPQLRDLAITIGKDRQKEEPKKQNAPLILFTDQKRDRNDVCFCGSGKKYKKCHGVAKL